MFVYSGDYLPEMVTSYDPLFIHPQAVSVFNVSKFFDVFQ